MKLPVRIHMKRGRAVKKFVLERGPVPRIGDTCTLPDKSDWTVTKLEKLKGPIFHVTFPAVKSRRVFP